MQFLVCARPVCYVRACVLYGEWLPDAKEGKVYPGFVAKEPEAAGCDVYVGFNHYCYYNVDKWRMGCEWCYGGGGKTLILKSILIAKPYCNHLWFLKAIFVLNMLNPIIYTFIHGNERRLKYLLVLLGLCTIKFLDIIVCRFANPLLNWQTAFSVLYYVLGYAVLDGHLKTDNIKTWQIGGLIGVFALLQWGYNCILLDGAMSELNSAKKWVNDVVWDGYNAPFIVAMTTTVVMLFQRIEWKGCRWIQFIGQYSLAIYVMQTPVQRLWEVILPVREWIAMCHICGLILPILTIATSMLITRLLITNKYTRYWIEI